MNVALHQRAEGIIHHAVATHRRLAAEPLGDDRDPEMASAFPGASVPGVQVALVNNIEPQRIQGCQSLPDGLDPVHGRTRLNGRTVTRA